MCEEKSFKNYIEEFIQTKSNSIVQNSKRNFDFTQKIYNEFSLQHELGNYLSKKDYEIFYEVNVNTLGLNIDSYKNNHIYFGDCKNKKDWVKKEIDIVAIKRDNNGNINEKYALELKFPQKGRYPEEMFEFIKDICFMEQVKECWSNTKTYCMTLVNDDGFYTEKRNKNKIIYKYFRTEKSNSIYFIENKEPIKYPTQKKNSSLPIQIIGNYNIEWQPLCEKMRYYCIEINEG